MAATTPRPIRVLLADDDEDVLGALVDLVAEQDGLELVGAAQSVEEALKLARKRRPDVALVDVGMPGTGGEGLTRALAHVAPRARVLAHSALDDGATVRRMLRAGAHGYVAKGHADSSVIDAIFAAARGDEVLQVRLAREAVLPESDDRWANLFENSPAGMMLIEKGGRPLRVNRSFCQMLGYTAAELCAMNARDFNHPDERAAVRQAMNDLWRGDVAMIRREKRYCRRDGSVVWGDLTATVVRGLDGSPLYVQAVVVDITDRKRAEAALHESEAGFRSLVEGLPGYIYRCDADALGTVTYVSPQVEELTGYTPAECLGRGTSAWAKTLHPHDRKNVLKEFGAALRDGRDFSLEYRIRTKRGETRWVRDHGTVIRDQSGAALYVQGVVLDMTERMQAEAALHESEAGFRGLVEGLPGYIYRCAADEVGTSTYVNPQVETLTGYTPEEHLGNGAGSWAEILHPEDREQVLAEFRAGIRNGQGYRIEYRLLTKNGETRWVRDHGAVICDAAGQALYVQGVVLDITEAKEVDGARRENEQKNRFLAGMSHELRTPLNSILGFAQLLASNSFGELNERQDRYVGHIHQAGQHLLSLINDLLDLAKVNSGQLELEMRSVDLREAVTDAVTKMTPQADAKGVVLEFDPALAQLRARADERRLAQVLLNLLSNAVKFTPAGGRILVRARPAGAGVEVSVEDTGVGISVPDQERIFEEFAQVAEANRSAPGGTGLGLPLTRRLLELMGGSISVRSQLGKGSTFVFTLEGGRTGA